MVIVDLYCGAGGMSEGAKEAVDELRERYPDMDFEIDHYAINHWKVAIHTHMLNHPGAVQICERIEALRPSEVVKGGVVHLLIAAPECIFHSRARGGRPVNDQRRAGAWTIHNWLTELDVKAILVENVKEFQEWGPLDPATQRPDKKRRGVIFQAWKRAIEDMGFVIQTGVRCCADYGDATTRERFFLLGRKDGLDFEFPATSHASPARIEQIIAQRGKGLFPDGPLPAPWRTARQIIDWDKKGTSVFDRDKALVENTLLRVDAGLRKFNGPNALPFVIALRHFMGLLPESGPVEPIEMMGGELCEFQPVIVTLRQHADGTSVDAPVPTVCADGNHIAVAEPVITKYYSTGDGQSVEDPLGTITTVDRFAVAEPFVARYQGGVKSKATRTRGIDEPLSTADTSNRFATVEPILLGQGGPEYAGKPTSIDEPLRTVTTESHKAVAEPFLLPHPRPSEKDRVESVDKPMRTITSSSSDHFVAEPTVVAIDNQGGNGAYATSTDVPVPTVTSKARFAVAEGSLVNMKGESTASSVDEPTPTQTTGYHLYLSEPFLTPHQKFGKVGQDSVDEPLRTIDATNGDKFGLAEPFLAPHQKFGEVGEDSIEAPLRTIDATNGRLNGLVESILIPFFGEREGQESRAHSIAEPLPTITSHGAGAVVQAFLIDVNHGTEKPEDNERRAQSVDQPLGTVTASRRGKALVIPVILGRTEAGRVRRGYQLITDDGVYFIDILIRMLQPDELAAATSFPEDYQFHGNKGDQVKQIGNAVPVKTAKALCLAQLEPLVRHYRELALGRAA